MIRPTRAMILAAGLGERMRPLTETLPKPLITVGGIALIDHVLERLEAFGVERILVNVHHHRAAMNAYLRTHRLTARIEIVPEPELLDTGASVAALLPRLGPGPFFVANADALWFDGLVPALARLAEAWREDRMDVLLLAQSTAKTLGFDGPGDCFIDPAGRARLRKGENIATHAYTGIALLTPRAFADAPTPPYSLRRIFDRAEEHGRLWAVAHDGLWFHVGTPGAIDEAEIELGYRHQPASAAEALY
jgi:MurNAc alpha-1-phosphate uridylyltransferase